MHLSTLLSTTTTRLSLLLLSMLLALASFLTTAPTTLAQSNCGESIIDAVSPDRIYATDFEGNAGDWFANGSFSLELTDTTARSGCQSLQASGRTEPYHGPVLDLQPLNLESGGIYEISLWVQSDQSAESTYSVTILKQDGNGTNYIKPARLTHSGSEWFQLKGVYEHGVSGSLQQLQLYLEQTASDPLADTLYIDAVVIRRIDSGDWEAEADSRIQRHRVDPLEITVVDSSGQPIEGATVEVTQERSDFAFGSAINAYSLDDQQYTDFFRENFEWATPEATGKWVHMEPQRDQLRSTELDRIVQFAQTNDIQLRGHTVYWGEDGQIQDWLAALSPAQQRKEIIERAQDLADRYSGDFEHWDVNNEMLYNSYFEDTIGGRIRADMFQYMQQRDPDAALYTNEYNIITFGATEDYLNLIEQLRADGAPVEGVGIQGHFSEFTSPYLIEYRLDQMARAQLPVVITEYDYTDPDENRRAEMLERVMRLAYSKPYMEGFLVWGFWEGQMFIPDAHLVNQDWSLNAAGQRYRALRDEWTTEANGQTNASGVYSVDGHHGRYRLQISYPDGSTQEITALEHLEGGTTLRVERGGDVIEPSPDPVGCRSDFNEDGFVDLEDYALLVGVFFETEDLGPMDIDGDGFVDLSDYGIFVQDFFTECG